MLSKGIQLAVILGVILCAAATSLLAAPVGTAFTYQGRLTDGDVPANGTYDLRFILYDTDIGGMQIGSIVTMDDVTVTTGLFTVTLDFGAAFDGDKRFLEIAARPGASGGTYTPLAPRHELTPTPNAIDSQTSQAAETAASAPWSGLTGTPAGFADGVDDDALNALSCASGEVAKWNGSAWACAADIDTNSGGTVTNVATGAGLTGGPVTTSGTIAVASGGITSDMIAPGAVGRAQINTSQVQPAHTGAVYRWAVFSTYDQNVNWMINNNAAMFGGVSPSNWTDGNYRAVHMSSNKEVLRTLLTNKGYAGANATVVADVWYCYSSTNGKVAVVLFRIRNTTTSAIVWPLTLYYTSYYTWSETAGVAVNGTELWNSGTNNCGGGSACSATVNMSIPAGRTSTVIVSSPSGTAYIVDGGEGLRTLVLAFYNNSLALPSGLEYVDDLDVATGGWDQ